MKNSEYFKFVRKRLALIVTIFVKIYVYEYDMT